jgi:hypothetical protein
VHANGSADEFDRTPFRILNRSPCRVRTSDVSREYWRSLSNSCHERGTRCGRRRFNIVVVHADPYPSVSARMFTGKHEEFDTVKQVYASNPVFEFVHLPETDTLGVSVSELPFVAPDVT